MLWYIYLLFSIANRDYRPYLKDITIHQWSSIMVSTRLNDAASCSSRSKAGSFSLGFHTANWFTVDKIRWMHVVIGLVMVHNPAHDLFSIAHFLCRVRVVDCCDLRNGAERQWFIVATISGNFFLLKSLLAGTTTVMHRYGPNDTYPRVFNMKRTTCPYLLADFYDASQFEMINFANVNIEHNSDPVISLFGNMQIMFQYMEYDVTCIN